MIAYHQDLSWLTNKNRSIYKKTFKQSDVSDVKS